MNQNIYYKLSAYYELDTVLSTWHIETHFINNTTYILFHWTGNNYYLNKFANINNQLATINFKPDYMNSYDNSNLLTPDQKVTLDNLLSEINDYNTRIISIANNFNSYRVLVYFQTLS